MVSKTQSAALSATDRSGQTPGEIQTRRKRDLALGYRIFAALGWGDLGDGHISARDPQRTDCFWVLRDGVPYPDATVKDLVLVGPNGEFVEGDGPINVSAYHIHHPIHKARPNVVSAAHIHTGWGTPFSAELRPIEPITQEACIFYEDCALFDEEEAQILSADGGARIAVTLDSNTAVILRSHGILTVGDSVSEAVGLFVLLERVAESHRKARDAKPISPQAARIAKADLIKDGAGKVAFRHLVSRYVGDPSIVQ